jgi:L-threonylcarbamoyladenylate synthase
VNAPAAVLDAHGDPPPRAALAAAVAALGAGQVVGVPTDTVYGLAVDAARPGATERVFEAKLRPRAVGLPVLVAEAADVDAVAAGVPEVARALMRRFWPGGLTVVLARRADLDLDLGDDETTVGVRCPDHPVIRSLCRMVGPLATTSANRHGEPPAVEALEVAGLAGVDLVLDAGRCAGLPSTVVDCTGSRPRLLRAGALSWAAIEAVPPA